MDNFYALTLTKLLNRGVLDRGHRILVVCGGRPDQEVLLGLGFQKVTISNLDERMTGNEFAPFEWSYQDAEALSCGDAQFDFCIVHNGLHHCYSPHRALLEMYRVASKGIIVFEPRESLLVRLGVALKFGQDYEVAAVAGNNLQFGGVRNTAIPNFVYRWTEREVEKTVLCFDPVARPRFHYFYALRVPEEKLRASKNKVMVATARLVIPVLRLATRLFPKLGNGFAFAVEKPVLPRDVQPWLRVAEGRPAIDPAWVRQRYGEFK